MKKTLLLGALSLLSMLHGQKPSLALTRKAAASNASLVQLDSLITLQQKGQVAGYDTLLYVYHNRDPRDPYQIDQNSYFLHGGSKDNRDKVETVKQAFVDSTVYTQTSSIWNTSLGVWHNSFREVSTIDGDRRIVRRTTSGWDGLQGEWEPYKLYRTHYNSEGYVSLEEELAWDEAQKNWIPLLKSTYTYESMGRLIKKETYKAGLHGWILVGRQVNVLDTQGKVLPDSTYELQGDVALHRATAYIYDAQGRLSKETKYNTAFTDTLAFIIAYNYMYSSAGDTLTK
ncbi:MAG TPA: hypothetical protein VL947_07585, partial [Cytophagales bacterium]|nr:hypothetical protein [Cytophagales bacterium]